MMIMADKNIRSVFVKPKDAGDVPGVIAVRDVVFKVLAKGVNPAKVKASDIASKPLVCVDKDMKVEYAAMLLDKFNIARVWVRAG
jgi:CBS domain-containing protein